MGKTVKSHLRLEISDNCWFKAGLAFFGWRRYQEGAASAFAPTFEQDGAEGQPGTQQYAGYPISQSGGKRDNDDRTSIYSFHLSFLLLRLRHSVLSRATVHSQQSDSPVSTAYILSCLISLPCHPTLHRHVHLLFLGFWNLIFPSICYVCPLVIFSYDNFPSAFSIAWIFVDLLAHQDNQ